MADLIADLSKPKGKNPVAQMPGAVEINPPKYQSGNTVAPAPAIKQTNAPNVDGGKASFSSVTQPLQDFVTAKTAELSASRDALAANTQIDSQATEQITGLTTSTIKALNNINKTSKLPGGSDGKIAKFFSLFDSDYNVDNQKTSIDIARAKASQISATAAAIKEQNNALPLLMGQVSAAEKLIFDAQKDANDLVIKQQTLDNSVMQTRIAAAHLKIDQSQEARAATDFRIRGMSTAQIEAALPQAEAGKGPFKGLAGILKERLINEKAAETSLASANNALAKGNRDEYNESLIDFVSHMPSDIVTGLMTQSQKGGNPMVSFPTGEKGKTIEIPYNLVQQGLIKSIASRDQVNKAVSADLTERLSIIPNINNIIKSGNALSSLDPRATRAVVSASALSGMIDPNNPESVRQVGNVLEGLNKDIENIGKEQAAKMGTPEAKAAVVAFAKNGGKFDSAGGAAVVADSVSIPSLSTHSKFANAWDQMRIMVANQVAQQHQGSGVTVNNGSDAQSSLSIFTASGGKEKISQISQQLLTDPIKIKSVRDSMKGTIRAGGVLNVVTQLAHQKDANPFWANILSNIESFKEEGKPSPKLLFDAMEKARIVSHNKLDFTKQFFSGLQNYAMNADNASSSDPSYTMQDHALAAAIFGADPSSSVLGELHYTLRQAAEKARKEMSARIQKDLTGETQKQSVAGDAVKSGTYDAVFGPAGIITAWSADKFEKKTGMNIHDVPSASGTGLSVAQIQAIYQQKGNEN